jgi:hypothetical protein
MVIWAKVDPKQLSIVIIFLGLCVINLRTLFFDGSHGYKKLTRDPEFTVADWTTA